RVIEDMRGWLDAGVTFDHVAVNAGAAEFRFDDFGESVLERLLRAGVPTSCFQLEVTETVFLGRGSECVERALKLLSAAGIRIALDDFGTGYASLRHLKQFPVDVIKIDRSFVADMVGHDGNAAIIEAVLHLGRSLKMNVVAEGIETQGQEDRLRALGCEFGQGFLYSKAVPGNSVAALLAKFKGPWSSNAMF
ncbi:MAG TPA: EAL domain-containing protein, partial [Terriglobales bacterium]|nr:EAL domain-containing protein [Terriglobales bacterium]